MLRALPGPPPRLFAVLLPGRETVFQENDDVDSSVFIRAILFTHKVPLQRIKFNEMTTYCSCSSIHILSQQPLYWQSPQ